MLQIRPESLELQYKLAYTGQTFFQNRKRVEHSMHCGVWPIQNCDELERWLNCRIGTFLYNQRQSSEMFAVVRFCKWYATGQCFSYHQLIRTYPSEKQLRPDNQFTREMFSDRHMNLMQSSLTLMTMGEGHMCYLSQVTNYTCSISQDKTRLGN